jgi:hypothetical protein
VWPEAISFFISPDTSSRPQNQLQIDQTVVVGDITARAVEANFSSTETQLVLELSRPNPSAEAQRRGFQFLVPAQEIKFSGVEGPVGIGEQTSKTDPPRETDVLRLRFGRVVDPLRSVAIEFSRLAVMREDGGYDWFDGPWRFEFVPGLAAVDVIGIRLPIDWAINKDGLEIAVDDIRFSSSEILLDYTMRVYFDLEGFVLPVGREAVMRYPDGRFAIGRAITGRTVSSGSAPIGPITLSFPPLPEGIESFTIEFGPFTAQQSGTYAVTIDLAAKLVGIDRANPPSGTSIRLGQEILVNGEKLRVNTLRLEPGSIEVKAADAGGYA